MNAAAANPLGAPPADADAAAVRAVCAAAASAGPRLRPLDARVEVLTELAAALDAARDDAVQLAIEETALAPARLQGEVDRTVGQLRLFADAVRDGGIFEAILETSGDGGVPDLRRLLVPLGPVAVFSASNFPFAFSVLGGDTASALSAGCPVVVKAHPGHPRLSDFVAQLAANAVGEHVVQLVHGIAAGELLVQHPAIRAAGFTGSAAGALALQAAASVRPDPLPFYGELGSLNPVIVTRGALARDTDAIVSGLVASLSGSAGQLCTKPGLVLVPAGAGVAELLREQLAELAAAPMLNAAIRDRFVAGVETLREAPGLKAVVPTTRAGADVTPLAFVGAAATLPGEALEECFGPVTVLVEYASLGEAAALLDRLSGSLTVSVHCTDDEADALSALLDAAVARTGRVIFGGWPTGVAVSPAMHHGGPWPATTNALHTSVGTSAARRFLRPVCFQNAPQRMLPAELLDGNPLGILRRVDGVHTREPLPANAG